jgi:DHA1 family bicyclomycin/chloramphenicol resistance-like MFS transporter
MVGDLHAGEAATKAISTLTLAFGIMPGLSVALGGYITVAFGWQACFLFLSLYTVVLWLLCQLLPETAHELHKDALDLNKIGHGLARQMKDPFVMLHAFLTGLTTTIVYIFATLSPFIAIDRIGISPDQFGLWAFIPSLGIFTGSWITRSLSSRLNPRINMLSGLLVIITGTIVLSVCFANSYVTVWSLFIPMYFVYLGSNVIWTNAASKGLSEASDKSNASAVIQFTNMSTATIGVFLIGAFTPTATMLLPAALGLAIILMFITWLKLKEHHR